MKNFLPDNFEIKSWENVKPFFKALEKREIGSLDDLIEWLKDRSDLYEFLEEELAWRYINANRFTDNEKYKEEYFRYLEDILPEEERYENILDKKLVKNPFFDRLPDYPYGNLKKQTLLKLKVFNEKNLPLLATMRRMEQEFADITGKLTIVHDGKELTLQQASVYLQDRDRAVREKVYSSIAKKRKIVSEKLEELFDDLVSIRTQIAKNAGYNNYRDYKFDELGRTDYLPDDCFRFHEAVKKYVVPLVAKFYDKRKNLLGVDKLMPYDLEAELPNEVNPRPYNIVENTIFIFSQLDNEFGEYLKLMQDKGFLDLESRKNKAPGGFNYPLYKTGIPFIFANFAGTFNDLQTMVHEGGHAIHFFLTKDLDLIEFKNFPSEVAELASMSMELLSMKYWRKYFDSEAEFLTAQKRQLEGVISVLPWIAAVDKFQHLVYLNPEISIEERNNLWKGVITEFVPNILSYGEYEWYRDILWQKQLHIFEVPFYYIEYGFAQLGAIGVWKNFSKTNAVGIEMYKKALSLGYTKSISQIFSTAGAKFDFSDSYIRDLMNFVNNKIPNQ